MFEIPKARFLSGILAAMMAVWNICAFPAAAEDSTETAASGSAYTTDTTAETTAAVTTAGTEETTAVTDAAETDEPPAAPEENLVYQNVALYPEEEQGSKAVTLDGMMPEGADVTAVDVSDQYDGIAAYDITIMSGETAFQPAEESPILVEIVDPAIPADVPVTLWHVQDDGTREQILYFSAVEGKISFYAYGFSVYEIVKEEGTAAAGGWQLVNGIEDLLAHGSDGLYICNPGGFFFKNTEVSANNRIGIGKTKPATATPPDAAVPYFFEPVEGTTNKVYAYCYRDGEKIYVYNNNNNSLRLGTEATAFTVSYDDTNGFRFNNGAWYWNMQGGVNGSRFCSYNNADDVNARLNLMYYHVEGDDPFGLDGKTYGLMYYPGGTQGYAMMSSENPHALTEIVTRELGDPNGVTLYVDEGSAVSEWTFEAVGGDQYKLSCDGEYLTVSGNSLTMTASAEDAAVFHVLGDQNGRYQLKYSGQFVTYVPPAEGSTDPALFTLTPTGSTWLNLIGRADLNQQLLTFSAERISASDLQNDKMYIMYIRIWNPDTLKYDLYAIDRDGSLYPCYSEGGKIMWLGDGTTSFEWKFTEHLDAVTKEPNQYYEFYNPYSEKYLAPQLTGRQILSDDTIGINMEGRQNGDYSSQLVAWDKGRYAYIGVRPNADKTAIEPCGAAVSYPVFFATLDELNLTDRLHEVPTIDNKDYGITMKMVNFDKQSGMSYGNSNASEATWTYFGGSDSNQIKHGLLSNHLQENGYPVTNTNVDFAGAFANATEVNHLFLERVHDTSGYFEFDSCQNFATLKATDENGNVVGFNSSSEGYEDTVDFTVYHELGTHSRNNGSSPTLKHGQFFPYDTILPGVYTTANNTENLYTALANRENANVGKLPPEDPRKYEKLHLIQTEAPSEADFYFGMEMEAAFVQTPSGLDAWGHDIVFEFTGDDDFWLYVDDVLVLDLGGTHSAVMGKVNFRTGEVTFDKEGNKTHGTMETTNLRQIFTDNYMSNHPGATQAELNTYLSEYFAEGENIFRDYSNHKMKIFYMERGGNASNLYMHFNIAAVTPGQVVVGKNVVGSGAALLDMDFLEYPFQIYYTLPDGEGGVAGEEHLLENNDENICVVYENSGLPVSYSRKYRPPGFSEEQSYDHVYFVNPSRDIAINFPDGTISYRIVECAVDPSVYSTVTINGEAVPPERVEVRGTLKSYSTVPGSATQKPSLAFDNHVSDNVIKDLFVTKQLLDENDNEITDDSVTFDFRLSLSSIQVAPENIPQVSMHDYYVLSPEGKLCVFDQEEQKFVPTSVDYSREFISDLKAAAENNTTVSGISLYDVTFTTSPHGGISKIPAGYTICVPSLPVGSVFKVTEDNKEGYGLVGYEQILGERINEHQQHEPIPSYDQYAGHNTVNVGRVIAEENPQMMVVNKKGYSLSVNKSWSDLSITTAHDAVYVAVYVDGTLLPGTVRRIKSPDTSAYYFWNDLEPNADGTERTSMDGYTVREVKLTGAVVGDDNVVTSYATLTPVPDGGTIILNATRTPDMIPPGETNPDAEYEYVVSGEKGIPDGTTRTDTITNNRKGGIAVRLFRWDSTVPLKGGIFTLTDSQGNTVGEYTSDSQGIVTMLYDFRKNEMYTLTQTAAPRGYVGLQKNVCFRVENDNTVALFYEDGTPWGPQDEQDPHWANKKNGSDGFYGFVDLYNKPFNFKIAKMDSADHEHMLEGAHFALYKEAKTSIIGYVKNKDPLTGFEDMTTNEEGIVYVCGGDSGRTVNPGAEGAVYFLNETVAPRGYQRMEEDIILRISPLGVPSLISDSYNGRLVETEDSYIYTLDVPNTSMLYFDIEKTIFVDQYIHDSDPTQKFLFRIDRFAPNATVFTDPLDSFYVTLNCKDQAETPKTLPPVTDRFRYDADSGEVTVSYLDSESYTFPAAVWQGTQLVGVTEPGIYLVTEMAGWSETDYDFWDGTNVYRGFAGGGEKLTGTQTVKMIVTSANSSYKKDSTKTDRPTACFTNTENEYAFLSSQAFAENRFRVPVQEEQEAQS